MKWPCKATRPPRFLHLLTASGVWFPTQKKAGPQAGFFLPERPTYFFAASAGAGAGAGAGFIASLADFIASLVAPFAASVASFAAAVALSPASFAAAAALSPASFAAVAALSAAALASAACLSLQPTTARARAAAMKTDLFIIVSLDRLRNDPAYCFFSSFFSSLGASGAFIASFPGSPALPASGAGAGAGAGAGDAGAAGVAGLGAGAG